MATYLELANLATDAEFVKRLTYAVAKFASYILDEAENTPNHKARVKWASSAILNPSGVAQAVAPAVCLNEDVTYGLAEVLDPALQTAVETACGKLLFN